MKLGIQEVDIPECKGGRVRGVFGCKRVLSLLLIVGLIGATMLYFRYFRRPPVQDILAQNVALFLSNEARSAGDYDYYEDVPGLSGESPLLAMTPSLSNRVWKRFLQENHYVKIGSIWNKCAGEDRIQIGTTVLVADEEKGGITSRTFLNVTLTEEYTEGDMKIEVKYNGKELYSTTWNFCELDINDREKRQIFCPLKKGHHRYIKHMKIPNFLPKGTYYIKISVFKQDDSYLGCGTTEFTI